MKKYVLLAVICVGLSQASAAMAQYRSGNYRQPMPQYPLPPVRYFQPNAGSTMTYLQQFQTPQYRQQVPALQFYGPPQYIQPNPPATPIYPGTYQYYPPPQHYLYYYR